MGEVKGRNALLRSVDECSNHDGCCRKDCLKGGCLGRVQADSMPTTEAARGESLTSGACPLSPSSLRVYD